MAQAACDRVLRDGNYRLLRTSWPELFPHLRGPQTDSDAEIVLHHARTQNPRIEFRLRAWSHRWLTERDLPSGLPDDLKPRAERVYPVVAEGVGISVNTKNELLLPVVNEVRAAMEAAVEEAYADKRTDPEHVRSRMNEARRRTYKSLLGSEMR